MIQMPEKGRDWAEVREEMIARGGGDAQWRDGKTAVYVFNAGPEISKVQHEAYGLYMAENGLGPLAFPSLAQMEKEVIGMGLSLLHGPEGSTGAMTSGGTDSITMAVKTARDYARSQGRAREQAQLGGAGAGPARGAERQEEEERKRTAVQGSRGHTPSATLPPPLSDE